jgi:predicted phage terminase large subunit-like protein
VCQTRWHEDDLAGWLIAESAINGEHWEVLHLPMVDDNGGILWPDRYPQTEVDGIRKAVGVATWEALYQGRPTPPEGAMFKKSWWKFYTELPKLPNGWDSVCQSWDMAVKDTGDYVVGQVWGKYKASYYLLDQVRGRWDFPRSCEMVKALAAKWPNMPILVEDKANGPAVIATLKSIVPGLVPVEPKGGKEARAAAVSYLVEGGNVYLPSREHAGYADELLAELSVFPKGAHDDMCDSMAQALNRLRQTQEWFKTPVIHPKRPVIEM